MSTVANIRGGGWTPVSGVICAGVLVAMVLGLGRYADYVPHAALAGILMRIGWGVIDWRFLTRIHRVQREHMLVMLLTLGLAVFFDFITAVAVGIIAAALTNSRQFEQLEADSVVSVPLLDQSFLQEQEGGTDGGDAAVSDAFASRVGLVSLRGSFSVASATSLTRTVSTDIRDHEVVILDFSETVYMDDSAALVVERLIETAGRHNTHCVVMALSGRPATTLDALNILRRVPKDHFADDLDEAREIARRLLVA